MMSFVTHLPRTPRRQCGMGDCGPVDKVDIFSSRTDDLHTREILSDVYPRDFPAT